MNVPTEPVATVQSGTRRRQSRVYQTLAALPVFWRFQIGGWALHAVLTMPLKLAPYSRRDAFLVALFAEPLGFLLTSWRNGPAGALRMGAAHGAWCVGCCWALMGALFALGIMSVAWMAFVAGLIAVEKILPWRRVATWGTAGLLLGLGVLMLAAPSGIPGLTIPSGGMPGMGM